jgi:hypothetical protein
MTRAQTMRAALMSGGLVVGVAAGYYLLRRDERDPAPAIAAPPWVSALEAARAAGVRAGELGLEPAAKRNATEPRNARSAWRRPVEDDGTWAAWLRPLQGQTGVYLIRDRDSGELLYIGECHRPKQGLLKTMRRHFWQWSGPTAGPTFDPRYVEVSYELTGPGEDATARQFELIRKLEPQHNVQDGRSLLPSLDEVPF